MAKATTTQILTTIKEWVLGKLADVWALIPSQASSSNQLADKAFVNSSIATATATFRGTYNLVSDLSLTTSATQQQIAAALATKMTALSIVPDANDYAFVQIPTADATPTEIAKIEKYKYNGTVWGFEYELNNSGFTAAQWAAINSGATLELIGKLSALPTNTELTALLDGKQNVISDLVTIRSGASAGSTAYQKPTTGIPSTDLASGVIPDVSSFITASVNNLANYYLKSETYTKAEVAALIGAIQQFHYEIYASTSEVTTPANNVLYLIGPASVSGSDKYEEYVYANNAFVKIGDTSIDLSGYVTTTALNNALADYTTTANLTALLSGKQDVIQDLTTIRSGASAGATAVQPAALSAALVQTVAESGVFDLSAHNAVNGVLATYADLSAALTTLNALSSEYKKPGMSFKFIQSSDNKYVQHRLMAQDFSTTESDWQGVDDVPTAGSNNIVKSGGVTNLMGNILPLSKASLKINDKIITTSTKKVISLDGAKCFLYPLNGSGAIKYTTSVNSVLILLPDDNLTINRVISDAIILDANTEYNYTTDSKYLYVLSLYNGEDRIPSSVFVNGYDVLKDIKTHLKELSDDFNNLTIPNSKLEVNAVATNNIQDNAVTFAKRTQSGNLAYYSGSIRFNTTSKTLTLYANLRVFSRLQKLAINPWGSDMVIDISSCQEGIIALNVAKTATTFKNTNIVIIPTSSTGGIVINENYIVLCCYKDWGATVTSNGSYSINGKRFGIDTLNVGSFGLLVNISQNVPLHFDSINKVCKISAYSRLISRTKYYNLSPFNTDISIDLSGTQDGLIVVNLPSANTNITTANVSVMSIASGSGNILTKDSIIIAGYNDYGKYVWTHNKYVVDGNLYGIKTGINVISPTFDIINLPSGIEWWSDFITITIDGVDEMWFFKSSSGETHETSNGKIYRVRMSDWTLLGSITHNFGHCNNVQYDKVSDTIIMGNLPGNETYPSAVYIYYNVSSWVNQQSLDFSTLSPSIIDVSAVIGAQLSAFYGENSIGKRNIVYLIQSYSSNKVGKFAKIVLGMGTNELSNGTYDSSHSGATEFNGTYNILIPSTDFELFANDDNNKNVIQGGDYADGKIITANGHDQIFGYIWSVDTSQKVIRTQINTCPRKADGSIDYSVGEGLCVKDNYVYHGLIKLNSDFRTGTYTIEGYYLAKYHLPY